LIKALDIAEAHPPQRLSRPHGPDDALAGLVTDQLQDVDWACAQPLIFTKRRLDDMALRWEHNLRLLRLFVTYDDDGFL